MDRSNVYDFLASNLNPTRCDLTFVTYVVSLIYPILLQSRKCRLAIGKQIVTQ